MRTRVVCNGREYSSPSEMAPDVRRIYDTAMRQMALNGGRSMHVTSGSAPLRPGAVVGMGAAPTTVTTRRVVYRSVDRPRYQKPVLPRNALQWNIAGALPIIVVLVLGYVFVRA